MKKTSMIANHRSICSRNDNITLETGSLTSVIVRSLKISVKCLEGSYENWILIKKKSALQKSGALLDDMPGRTVLP